MLESSSVVQFILTGDFAEDAFDCARAAFASHTDFQFVNHSSSFDHLVFFGGKSNFFLLL